MAPWGNVGDVYSFADADGNGCADAIIVNAAGIWVRRSAGLTSRDGTNWTGRTFLGDVGTFFADVNADSKADAIAVNR